MQKKIIPCKVRDQYVIGAGVVVGAAGSGADAALRLEFGPMWDDLVKYVTFRNALGEEPVVCLLTTDMIQRIEEPELPDHPPREPQEPERLEDGWNPDGYLPPPPPPIPECGCQCLECLAGQEDKEPEAPAYRIVYDVTIPAKAKAIAGQMGVTVHGYELSDDGSQVEAAAMTAQAKFRVLPSGWSMPESEGFTPPTVAQQLQAQIEDIRKDITDAAQAADAKEAAKQSAVTAAKAVKEAQAAKTEAEEAQGAAEDAQAAAEAAKTGAETARSGAEAARTGAETAQSGAQAAQTAAEAAKTGAETAKTGAETARAGAESAQTGAKAAKTGAETAKSGAETARQRAEEEAAAARVWAERSGRSADRSEEKAEASQEQADRAKYEADRAQAAAGGDFVTDPEFVRAVADMGMAPLVGPAELVGELLPGGVLFITDEALPEDYAVTLEQLLAEGDKAYAGQADALETMLTVGVAKVLGLRADGEGSEYTLATLPSLRADIRALCAAAQAGGSYVLDGKTAVSHRQVQYYILHKSLVSHSLASAENWSWMGDVRTEIQALRYEIAQLRAQIGDVNETLDGVLEGERDHE